MNYGSAIAAIVDNYFRLYFRKGLYAHKHELIRLLDEFHESELTKLNARDTDKAPA